MVRRCKEAANPETPSLVRWAAHVRALAAIVCVQGTGRPCSISFHMRHVRAGEHGDVGGVGGGVGGELGGDGFGLRDGVAVGA